MVVAHRLDSQQTSSRLVEVDSSNGRRPRQSGSSHMAAARSIDDQHDDDALKSPINDNQSQADLANRCSGALDGPAGQGQAQPFEPLDKEQEQILSSLRIYYDLNATQSVAYTIGHHNNNNQAQQRQLQQQAKDKIDSARASDVAPTTNELARKGLPQLPRPSNLSVLIISWYPPILKLSWNLDEFEANGGGRGGGGAGSGPHERPEPTRDQAKQRRRQDNINNNRSNESNLHRDRGGALETNGTPTTTATATTTTTSLPRSNDNDDNQAPAFGTSNELGAGGLGGPGFDLELALEQADAEAASEAAASRGPDDGLRHQHEPGSLAGRLRELKLRRFLVEKSLTCFQVTYNVVNSR